MTNLELLHRTVAHYLKHNFHSVTIEGEKKVAYMMENALRISLGRSYDHTEYCLWLADNAPYYGVLVKDYATLVALKRRNRVDKHKHSKLSTQVQLKIKNLKIETQVLILLNASQFSTKRQKIIIRSWPSTKPLIYIG